MSEKRIIDVRKQKKLSLGKSLRLCLSGIRHRLLRSSLTLAVVVLAVAFFMFLMAENAFLQSVSLGVQKEIDKQREAVHFLSFAFSPPSSENLARNLAIAWFKKRDTLKEYAAISRSSYKEVLDIAEKCVWEQQYIKFFNDLEMGTRRILIHKHKGRDIFRYLAQPEVWQRFSKDIRLLRSLNAPHGLDYLKRFTLGFARYEKDMAAFSRKLEERLTEYEQACRALTGDVKVEEWLAWVDDNPFEQWCTLSERFGFVMPADKATRIRTTLHLSSMRQRIAQKLNASEKRKEWQRIFMKKIGLDEKMLKLDDPKVVALLDNDYTQQELRAITDMVAYENRLAELEKRTMVEFDFTSDDSLLSGRQIFLLMISFLVCMVGIANAMLMAITERFREIATMKCLGATDGFILIQFMLEACLQGLFGGLLGMLIGFGLSLIKSFISYGMLAMEHMTLNMCMQYLFLDNYLIQYFPAGEIIYNGFLSLAVGIILAVLASLYPSWSASRMAPVEAMRVE